jgi:aminopeptidase-like protein
VLIETREQPGHLEIFEYTIKGELDHTVCFVAHLDHPGMANDDLAGCAVGIELFKGLSQKKTKYTYKLLLVQEIIGSVYYLNALSEKEKKQIFSSVFLEMLGTETPLKLQRAFSENPLEPHLINNLNKLNQATSDELFYGFRELIGNDEIVFEAYNIPMSSVSRFPYKEYHTSKDNLDIINNEALKESVLFFEHTINDFEHDSLIIKEFEGLMALSNPKYDLYVDPQLNQGYGKELRHLMDFMAFIQRPYTSSELSERFNIPVKILLAYLRKWEEKKLIRIV